MSKLNMHVCMFRFKWGSTRLARQARGGLFALRVTRRGHFMFTGHDPMAAAVVVVPVGDSAKFGSFHLEMFGFVFARGK